MGLKIMMSSSPTITKLDGVTCRVWTGFTEGKIPVVVLVHAVMIEDGADNEAFLKEAALADLGMTFCTIEEVQVAFATAKRSGLN